MMSNDPLVRLERLENRLSWGQEIEDLRAVDVELYGLEAVREIYKLEGPESLHELLKDPDLSEESKIIIADFLSRNQK